MTFSRAVREFGDQREHLIAEAADVDDLGRLLDLGRAVRLDVDADHFSIGGSLFKDVPLPHRFGRRGAAVSSISGRIHPRFVVRDVNHQIALGLDFVQVRQAVRSRNDPESKADDGIRTRNLRLLRQCNSTSIRSPIFQKINDGDKGW